MSTVEPFLGMLPDLEGGLLPVPDQEIPGVLVIDLQHAEGHLVGGTYDK